MADATLQRWSVLRFFSVWNNGTQWRARTKGTALDDTISSFSSELSCITGKVAQINKKYCIIKTELSICPRFVFRNFSNHSITPIQLKPKHILVKQSVSYGYTRFGGPGECWRTGAGLLHLGAFIAAAAHAHRKIIYRKSSKHNYSPAKGNMFN